MTMRMREAAAHKLVANLAEESAQEIYETLAHKNAFYADHPDRRDFVKRVAPTLLADARRTLAEMLGRHDVSLEEKDYIHQALVLDSSLPRPGAWAIAGNA